MGSTGAGGGAGEGWRWAALAAAVWIQAAAGTNFDFPAYSTGLKAALGASQAGLNGLAVASDLGKALGWSSGVAALRLPLQAVLAAAAAMGLAGYGLQWLLVAQCLRLHYATVFAMCLVAGCSICWFNTACFAFCTRAFPCPRRRPLALSLSVSFNGASAALYSLLAAAAAAPAPSLYLLLNALVPLAASLAALPPALRYSSPNATEDDDDDNADDEGVFLALHALAFLTGVYLLVLTPFSSGGTAAARLLLAGAAVLLLLPVFASPVLRARPRGNPTKKEADRAIELLQETILDGAASDSDDGNSQDGRARGSTPRKPSRWCSFLEGVTRRDQLATLGEEHTAGRLLSRIDFWLYYAGYLCGATVGLVYSNNLGQMAQSLGRGGDGTTALVRVYSACSFFGRLLSSFPDLVIPAEKGRPARTGWLAAGLAPMPVAFFLLAGGGSSAGVLLVCTAMVGLSSGFVFAAAVSVTAELFGADSVGVNHNILVSNIPLGSLLYGLLAAHVYDAGARGGVVSAPSGHGVGVAVVCMGEQCYAGTFRWWGCITTVGLTCNAALFLRTREAYGRFFESPRRWPAEKDGVWLEEL